jgi:hypothetical protein
VQRPRQARFKVQKVYFQFKQKCTALPGNFPIDSRSIDRIKIVRLFANRVKLFDSFRQLLYDRFSYFHEFQKTGTISIPIVQMMFDNSTVVSDNGTNFSLSPDIIRQSAHRRPNSPGARYKHALPGRIATARSPVAQRYHQKFLKWICVFFV